MDAQALFLDFCRSVGLGPAKPISLPEGKLVRYRSEDDKAGALNCYAVLHTSPDVWGVVGSWRTGARHAWRHETQQRLTRAELRTLHAQRKAAEAARRADERRAQAEAQAKALRLWRIARPASGTHPYLQRKGVQAYGIRQLGERLVVPARTSDGTLWTLQFIDGTGTKRFLTGGRIGGCYCAIGVPQGELLVCEGYATAATLYMATGKATAAAFSANNLARVALALRSKFPHARIVVCGDNDLNTPGNPGRTAAIGAARAVGGLVALPEAPRS